MVVVVEGGGDGRGGGGWWWVGGGGGWCMVNGFSEHLDSLCPHTLDREGVGGFRVCINMLIIMIIVI